MKKQQLAAILAVISGFCAHQARASIISIPPSKDNTLFQDLTGGSSNGSGDYLFAGMTVGENIRRAVLAFDVASAIPSGSTINSASLTLNMSRCGPTCSTSVNFELHRLIADWGEGGSDAEGQEGIPAEAQPGDATWLHNFYSNSFWANPGGDFTNLASSVQTVKNVGPYTWSSTSQMVADVQSWLNAPSNNYGWILLGGELNAGTAKRFDSRENPGFGNQPMLLIDYTPVPEPSTILFVTAGAIGLFRARRR